ncbi:MAG: hypothetical protein SOT46_01410 [Treponema sp.]|nr:hypothetical protein [Treponema sp.]
MAEKRQTFSKDFKAKGTLEALREEFTIKEIAVKMYKCLKNEKSFLYSSKTCNHTHRN